MSPIPTADSQSVVFPPPTLANTGGGGRLIRCRQDPRSTAVAALPALASGFSVASSFFLWRWADPVLPLSWAKDGGRAVGRAVERSPTDLTWGN
ncbi:uncharacterized protein PG986_007821 [Apiospora aurea]|uniref:Uncharacterized protein n=1 Tax=Apiospora aurea TaxID=335848 RepID=A0ABR1QDN4_9PEZI